MGARHKINVAMFNGCLLIAVIVGVVCESWKVFLAVLAFLSVSAWYSSDIRLTRRRK